MGRVSLAVTFFALPVFYALSPLAASAQADEFPKLPAGAGRDVMVRVCSGCHSPEAVASEARDAAGWKELIVQMKENGADATDAQFAQITAYLAGAFPKK